MGKLRKTKKRTWGKRQSCSSNPSGKSHRSAAKRGFMGEGTSSSKLTVEALAKHDERTEDDDVELDEDAETVKTGKSFATVSISGLTDCSNPTFTGVLKRFWQSPGANHQEICAVLAAVTEVIRKNGGKETETEYFAALMTALETTDDENSLGAISFLLALVIKRVPKSVLQVKFSPVCQVILNILATRADSQSTALLKSVVSCLAEALKVQETSVWYESSTMKSYQGLLTFTVHSKPKVRKCAQESVSVLLKKSVPGDVDFHPACKLTTKFCIQQLEMYKGANQAVTTLHILGLLKNVMVSLPSQQVKSLCETMLKLMTLGNVMLSMNCMQVLHSLFLGHPSSSTVTPELNGQLINALFDYPPSTDDEQQAVEWLTLMQKAYCNFHKLESKVCAESCSKLFAVCMTYFLSHHSTVRQTAGSTMKCLLEECIAPVAPNLADELIDKNKSTSSVLTILRSLESCLQYRYQGSWTIILDVITKFFEVFGKLCPKILKKCLVSLCNLHNSHDIKCRHELQRTVGMAFYTMGPKFVLAAVPLELDKENDACEFPRSWLLPVMRDHISETEMLFFFEKFLPLANTLHSKAAQHKSNGNELEAKVFETLYLQIWDLLPAFCTKPTDVCQNFKTVAKTMGTLMNERVELRMTICHAIRNLISRSLNNEEDRKELSKFAKNYLPILFNIYTACDEGSDSVSLPVLETLKCYLQITDQQLVKQFFKKAVERIKHDETTSEKQHMLMDLVIAMVPFLDEESIESLYKTVLPWLQVKDMRLQKKSYRILEEICSASSQSTQEFVSEHMTEIQEILLKTVTTAASVSKAPRLRCLIQVVKKLTPGQESFLNSVIPEVILGTKEVNSKARTSSLKLLVEIGNTLVRCSDQATQDRIENYLGTLIAGFGGSPNMVSGTIIAISQIVYEFKGSISRHVLEQLIKTMTNLLLSNKREIVKSALGFFKVAISVTSADDFSPFLQDLVVALVNWNEDSRNKFRFKAQVLFERLMRKFGFKVIYPLVPEKHRKFIHNIHKSVERAKRKKMEAHANKMKSSRDHMNIDSYEDLMFGSDQEKEEEEDDLAEIQVKKERKPKKKIQSKAFIRENEPDEPVDLLSSSISQHVTATKPSEKRVNESGFEVAADGRLIIAEENEELSKKSEKLAATFSVLEEDINIDLSSKKNIKRKMADSDDETAEAGRRSKRRGVEFGEEYRAKKAGGDIRKKGKPDPYAYVPLNTQTLNKRKRAKLSGQFQGIVKSARKGAQRSRKGHKKKK